MGSNVNFVAVIVAAVASMIVGFLWYSPILLGNQWMELKGYTKESLKSAQKEMGKLYAVSFVVAIITAYVLSHVMILSMNFYNFSKMQTGFTIAFWMWLGFVMPTQVTATIFGDKKWGLLKIDSGYQLASLIVMAAVLALF